MAGSPVFNPALTDKFPRISWADDKRGLYISEVQTSDAGIFTCSGKERHVLNIIGIHVAPAQILKLMGSFQTLTLSSLIQLINNDNFVTKIYN